LSVGSSVPDLGFYIGIPEDVPSVAAVNDVAVEGDTELQDGDRVSLFPAAGG
jgi:molybdopterin converting factor small subunit